MCFQSDPCSQRLFITSENASMLYNLSSRLYTGDVDMISLKLNRWINRLISVFTVSFVPINEQCVI